MGVLDGNDFHCYPKAPCFYQFISASSHRSTFPKTVANEKLACRIGQRPVEALIRKWECRRIVRTLRVAENSSANFVIQ